MNTQDTKTPLWIELQATRTDRYQSGVNDRVIRVRLVPCERHGYSGQSLRYFGGSDDLGDLTASTHIFGKYDLPESMTVTYENPMHVGLSRAEQMTKTLRKIEAKLDKVSASQGGPLSLGQWVLRFANAIGAVGVLYTSPDNVLCEATNGNVVSTVDWQVSQQYKWAKGEKDE